MTSSRSRRRVLAFPAAVPAIALGLVLALVAPADATAYSLAGKSAPDPTPNRPTQIWRLRTGNDGTFDRIVLDQRFARSGYRVHYVRQVTADPSGMPVDLRGNYYLVIAVPDSATDGAAGAPTYVHNTYTPLLPEVRQIKKIGEFEGVVSFGVGLRHKRDFRVLRLTSPLRLIIDVKH